MEPKAPLVFPSLEAGLELDRFRLPPKPKKMPVLRIVPDGAAYGSRLPCAQVADDMTLRDWMVCTPVTRGTSDELTWAGILPLLDRMKQLPSDVWIEESYPDFKPAVNLDKLTGGGDEVLSILAGSAQVRGRSLWRVCIGVDGDGVSARMWLGGVPVAHGQYVRLERGRYTVVILASTGKRRYPWQWNGRVLAPRLTMIDKSDIDALHAWELSRWKELRDAARGSAVHALPGELQFDPATLRGSKGFFRAGRALDGKWWFIDPDGRPFFYKGMCALNQGDPGGRRMGKPPVEDARVKSWIAICRSWGFNALGAWTTREFFNRGIPFTEVIEAFFVEPWLSPSFPDVFDPQWAERVDRKCEAVCTPLRDSRDLVGYFVENERGFRESLRCDQRIHAVAPTFTRAREQKRSDEVNAAVPEFNPEGMGLLQWLLSIEEERPGVIEARSFIRKRHGSIEAATRKWGVDGSGEGVVRELGLRGEILISPEYLSDEADFLRVWIDRFFSVVVTAIRRHDPNHLVLGCRWGGIPGHVSLEVEKRWVDVISQNSYQAEMMERIDGTCQETGLPLLVGEASSTTDAMCYRRAPIEPPGGLRHWRTRQALRTFDGFTRLARHPNIVGYTMYKWNGEIPPQTSVECIGRANFVAGRYARDWRGMTDGSGAGPLHGQVFLTLLGAVVGKDLLPSPGDPVAHSVRETFEHIYLGIVLHEGEPHERVYGNGIRGAIVRSRREQSAYELEIRLSMIRGMFTFREGEARYTLRLQCQGDILTGDYDGVFGETTVAGKVMGYLHRPVPSVRL